MYNECINKYFSYYQEHTHLPFFFITSLDNKDEELVSQKYTVLQQNQCLLIDVIAN